MTTVTTKRCEREHCGGTIFQELDPDLGMVETCNLCGRPPEEDEFLEKASTNIAGRKFNESQREKRARLERSKEVILKDLKTKSFGLVREEWGIDQPLWRVLRKNWDIAKRPGGRGHKQRPRIQKKSLKCQDCPFFEKYQQLEREYAGYRRAVMDQAGAESEESGRDR